jgi:hypothetical protein
MAGEHGLFSSVRPVVGKHVNVRDKNLNCGLSPDGPRQNLLRFRRVPRAIQELEELPKRQTESVAS